MTDIIQRGSPATGHDIADPVDNAAFVIMVMPVEDDIDMKTIEYRFPDQA